MLAERVMVEKAYGIIKKSKHIHVCLEVPLYGRSIDLACYSKGKIVTMEFKIKNWKKALMQARDHLLGADYAYVCMPKQTLRTNIIEEIAETGIGLLFFNDSKKWPFETVVKAKRSVGTWEAAKRSVVQFVTDNSRR